jgi:hypothetical protein
MDRGKRMPIRRLSHRDVIQMLSLHIPVLSSASDHFLVQHANSLPSQSPKRIDTNSLPSQSSFSSLFLPLCLFFSVSVYDKWVQSVTGIFIMSDSMCTCAAARGRHMVQEWWVTKFVMACKKEDEQVVQSYHRCF